MLSLMEYRVFLTCCAILISVVSPGAVGSNDSGSGQSNDLHVLLMTSSSRQFNSTGAERAVRIALDLVNANSAVLPGYSLQLAAAVRDTKCDGPTAVREFLSQVQLPSPRTIIGVIGCGCSAATSPVAGVTPLYGLPLISYTPTGGPVSDQVGHFQLFPPEQTFVNSLLAVVRQFGWRQLSILTQLDQPFLKMQQVLITEFTSNNITVLSSAQFDRDQNPSDVKNIFVDTSRVFFVNAYEDKARQLLCTFKRERIDGARYAWLLYGWYSEEWWKHTGDVNCTEEELAALLEGAIVIQQYPIAADNTALNFSSDAPFVETLAYDSIWTLALALNRTVNTITTNAVPDCCGGPPPVPLEEFSYGSNTTACLIRNSLSKTNFTGLTGEVRFSNDGTREQSTTAVVRILQYRNDSSRLQPIQFATVRSANTQNATLRFLKEENLSTVWKDGFPPHDGTPVTVIFPFRPVTIVFTYSLGITGIIITTICLLFNIIYRNRKIIRLTSPNLNYFILIGSYLIFITPFFELPIYTNNLNVWTANCVILIFVNNIGYTLVFATILAKLGRLYFIFHDPMKMRKRNVSDWRMACFICIDVSFVVAIIIIGNSIPFTRPTAQTVPDAETLPRDINGTLHRFVIITCWSTASSLFAAFLYIHIAGLQVASFILALLNRKIDIKVLNDSHQIRAIVYITTLAAFEVLFLLFIVESYRNARTILTSGHQLGATIAVNLILFVPKMVSLYKDPEGKNIFSYKQDTNADTLKRQSSRNNTIDNIMSPPKEQQTNWQLVTSPVLTASPSKLEHQQSISVSPDELIIESENANNKPRCRDINTTQ